jgi:hypothetical protein
VSGLPDLAALSGWMRGVERQLRDLATGNPLNRGAVQSADGRMVGLQSLSFGSVADERVGLFEMTGEIGGPGGVGWFAADGPSAWVLVTGGRLRVDVAGALTASGNRCSVFLSYAALGPSTEAGGPAGPERVAPAYTRAVEVQHDGAVGMDTRAAAGTFGLHTGLPAGWYLVAARYAMSYSGNPDVPPTGSVENRRLLATPF